MKTREEYIAKMKQQLDDLNSAIEEYENKAHQAQGDAQVVYKDNLFKLRQQLALTRQKLEVLKTSTESNWDQLVAEIERVRDVLIDSFHYFKTHI